MDPVPRPVVGVRTTEDRQDWGQGPGVESPKNGVGVFSGRSSHGPLPGPVRPVQGAQTSVSPTTYWGLSGPTPGVSRSPVQSSESTRGPETPTRTETEWHTPPTETSVPDPVSTSGCGRVHRGPPSVLRRPPRDGILTCPSKGPASPVMPSTCLSRVSGLPTRVETVGVDSQGRGKRRSGDFESTSVDEICFKGFLSSVASERVRQ